MIYFIFQWSDKLEISPVLESDSIWCLPPPSFLSEEKYFRLLQVESIQLHCTMDLSGNLHLKKTQKNTYFTECTESNKQRLAVRHTLVQIAPADVLHIFLTSHSWQMFIKFCAQNWCLNPRQGLVSVFHCQNIIQNRTGISVKICHCVAKHGVKKLIEWSSVTTWCWVHKIPWWQKKTSICLKKSDFLQIAGWLIICGELNPRNSPECPETACSKTASCNKLLSAGMEPKMIEIFWKNEFAEGLKEYKQGRLSAWKPRIWAVRLHIEKKTGIKHPTNAKIKEKQNNTQICKCPPNRVSRNSKKKCKEEKNFLCKNLLVFQTA